MGYTHYHDRHNLARIIQRISTPNRSRRLDATWSCSVFVSSFVSDLIRVKISIGRGIQTVPVHRTVIYSVTNTLPMCFRMGKAVHLWHVRSPRKKKKVWDTLTILTSSTISPATSLTRSQKSLSWRPIFSGSQKLTSLKQAGYFEYGRKVVISPCLNCVRNRGS